MDVTMTVRIGRLVAHVKAEFTSTDMQGIHYYKITEPVKITNKRIMWSPSQGFPGLMRDITLAIYDYYWEHPEGKFFAVEKGADHA